MKTKLIVLTALLILITVVSVRAEEKKEPLDRIPVTGCPYGDSIPMEICSNYAPEPIENPIREEPTPVIRSVEPEVTIPEEATGK